ncbi:MAG: hypothetical protein PHU99_05765 [Candidatus Cloacimonetes bacterium]|jgi:nitrate reductase assembly molybdenum cofactor insertion protein NarJ|nr:hypothetical protein [Candidatus Cloacimonadota bacterium]MDY0337083.1 hypothetical protein [Candidatus Cloacimonadaceae bacterium]MCB5268704.1 hypothetical protein [Candidatus Cloacimonadota bacterium]MCK9334418.1 hypothetical protein [Candidatus Cloacimonadota bacterium]MDD2543911.1 hypothetical protein [Candidatus Cloacimonadota bacterium]
MAANGFRRFIPAYIPLALELFRHFRRDVNHNGNIRKSDKSAEKMATMEHMLVRLEKKIQVNRETYEKIANKILIWCAINSILLISIAVKIFFY